MKIGSQHKKAFESAYKLVTSGLLSSTFMNERGISATRNKIISFGTSQFELVDEDRFEAGSLLSYNKNGSTWFEILRNKNAVENENAEWVNFIELIAEEYHKKYSLTEFSQKPRTKSQIEKDSNEGKDAARKILATFFPHIHSYDFGQVQSAKDDIYGISLRLLVCGKNLPESVPVLCRIYFRDTGSNLVPISGQSVKDIENSISQIESSDSSAKISIDPNVIAKALSSLGELIAEKENPQFLKCIYCNDEVDMETIVRICSQNAQADITFDCRDVKVLGVSHVGWNSVIFDTYVDQSPVFRITAGINTSISMRCLNCNSEVLMIDNNVVTYQYQSGNKTYTEKVVLDYTKTNLGLTDQQLERIRQSGVFTDHLFKIECPNNVRKKNCSCIVCASTAKAYKKGDKIVYKCTDCDYPEVVYTSLKGEKLLTETLIYAKDIGDLVPRYDANGEPTCKACASCNRYFTKASFKKKNLCSFCYTASYPSDAAKSQAVANYKKYSGMLSLALRTKSLFASKYCYEDDDCLLFVIGENRYILNKDDIDEYGYIPKPIPSDLNKR